MSLRRLFLRWISGTAMALGVAFVVSNPAHAQSVPEGVPVWRFHGQVGGHFYTNSCLEGNYARGEYKMDWEGNPNEAFFIERSQINGTQALYRFFDAGHVRHFYTTSSNAEGATNFGFEGILGYIYPTQLDGTTALYRSYNPSSADHFYTISKDEWERSFSSYPLDHEVIGYVPTGGTILCRPDNPSLKVYQHKPSTNLGQAAINTVGQVIHDIVTPNGTQNSAKPNSTNTQGVVYQKCGNLRFGYDENYACCCYNTSNNQYCTRPRNHPTADTIEQCVWVCQNKSSCM
jgi:hypothetical protein